MILDQRAALGQEGDTDGDGGDRREVARQDAGEPEDRQRRGGEARERFGDRAAGDHLGGLLVLALVAYRSPARALDEDLSPRGVFGFRSNSSHRSPFFPS